MQRINTSLNTFDLLYWVDDLSVSANSAEQTEVRNTLIDALSVGEHYCKSQSECAICQSAQMTFADHEVFDIVRHSEEVAISDDVRQKVNANLRKEGFDDKFIYAALRSHSTETLVRVTTYRTTINDFGNPEYSKRGAVALMGSAMPTVFISPSFSKTLFSDVEVNAFVDEDSLGGGWGAESNAACNLMSQFVSDSVSDGNIGGVTMDNGVEKVEIDVYALGAINDGAREMVKIESHRIINSSKSHPILGRLNSGDKSWVVTSDGDGRHINELMREVLAAKDNPTLLTSEVIQFAKVVLSKQGISASIVS